jgi:hypothetical protein
MIGHLQPTLDGIHRNNEALSRVPIKNILIHYGEDISYMGDCCVNFGKLGHLRSCLNDPFLDLNLQPGIHQKYCSPILMNNPHVSQILGLDFKDIDLGNYDIVFCISYKETELLRILHDRYGDEIGNGRLRSAVFSLSKELLRTKSDSDFILPINSELIEKMRTPLPGELYISDEERDWAESWLYAKGVEKDDQLFVCCDSSSENYKLLNVIVYFDFLKYLLGKSRSKILIFDERGIGKADFYKVWLGDTIKDKLVVSEKMSLREDFRIIASRSTRLVFGPCTGLLHCASSIYNHYINKGMPLSELPRIITYTGIYPNTPLNAQFWWGNSPLVQCLFLKNIEGKKRIRLLSEMSSKERALNDSLACTEYTAEMLIDFIERG